MTNMQSVEGACVEKVSCSAQGQAVDGDERTLLQVETEGREQEARKSAMDNNSLSATNAITNKVEAEKDEDEEEENEDDDDFQDCDDGGDDDDDIDVDDEDRYHDVDYNAETVNGDEEEEVVSVNNDDVDDDVDDMPLPPLPPRYVRGCSGNEDEAMRRWKRTVKWRRDNDIDDLINKPQPKYDVMKKGFPIFIHGRSKEGFPVLYEQIGKSDIKTMKNDGGITMDMFVMHYTFFVECIWKISAEDDDEAQMITVEDVKGVGLWHLTPLVMSFIRQATHMMKSHHVERCYRSYVINAPRIFSGIWRIISPLLDPRTRTKVVILGPTYREHLLKDIAEDQLPREYGGSSDRALDDSDDERRIRELIARNAVVAGAADAAAKAAAASPSSVVGSADEPPPPSPPSPTADTDSASTITVISSSTAPSPPTTTMTVLVTASAAAPATASASDDSKAASVAGADGGGAAAGST